MWTKAIIKQVGELFDFFLSDDGELDVKSSQVLQPLHKLSKGCGSE